MPIQARTEFAAALNQLASEKGVDVKVVMEAIEQAALAAYRKDLALRNEEVIDDLEGYVAKIDPINGEISIMKGDKNVTPPGFARIAAQTAKQVIMQRLNEAEKGAITDEYSQKVGTVISGMIQRQEGNTYFVDLGRAEGILLPPEQTRDEYYHTGQRLKFFLKEIRDGRHGPEIVISRADANLVKGLFALEVPEVSTGSVVIQEVAREAGNRTKIAVVSTQDGVDPVGSMVGQKGVRVQAVITELGEEKIDVVPYSEDPIRYIAAALSPAKDVEVILTNKTEQEAKVKVADSQLSLAIGKGGQNVRLAAKLTGWRIDIEGTGEGAKEEKVIETAKIEEKAPAVKKTEEAIDKATEKAALDGATQPEPSKQEEARAEKDAQKDIVKEDISIDKNTQKVKLEEGLGSMAETPDAERGDILAFDRPDESEAPTVANTSETPNVSSAEPPFKPEPEKSEEAKKKQ